LINTTLQFSYTWSDPIFFFVVAFFLVIYFIATIFFLFLLIFSPFIIFVIGPN
jgi:hypothetical protein